MHFLALILGDDAADILAAIVFRNLLAYAIAGIMWIGVAAIHSSGLGALYLRRIFAWLLESRSLARWPDTFSPTLVANSLNADAA